MRLHAFLCASPLYPQDKQRDAALHACYVEAQRKSGIPDWAKVTFLQNGCAFDSAGYSVLRNPFPKNVSYNWLLCDANCEADYWLFLPEDCSVSPEGWITILKHMDQGKDCFALSKDPKALVCRRGIFRAVSTDLQALCDMNFLGKEIACVILRGELERRGFHCITKNWKRISEEPKRWGNELYGEINVADHPNINATRSLPTFHDYGLEGWKAPKEVLEEIFMKIVDRSFDQQRQSAERLKELICHYGPLITEVPYRGAVKELWDRLTGAGPSHQ